MLSHEELVLLLGGIDLAGSRRRACYRRIVLYLARADSTSDSAEVAGIKRELHWAHLKIQVPEGRLRLRRIRKCGPGS